MKFRFSRLLQGTSVRVGPAYVRLLWGFSRRERLVVVQRYSFPYPHIFVRRGTVRVILGWDAR